MHGVLNVAKSSGPTSHDVISIVRRAAGQKRVGHTGTLDPAATGVLVVCLGDATRVIEYLMDWQKEYRATVEFGIATDTEDQTGNVVEEIDASHVTQELLESVLPRFRGKIQQIPPMVSAVHHEGKRLYELARAGQVVERTPRPVEIYSLSLVEFIPGNRPRAVLDVQCSKGTYIRTLCVDIGLAVDCVAHMASLVRTRVGSFGLDKAISLDEIKERGTEHSLEDNLISIDDILTDMPFVAVSDDDLERVRNGVAIPADCLTTPSGVLPNLDIPVRMRGPAGDLLGIGILTHRSGDEIVLKPEKIFSNL